MSFIRIFKKLVAATGFQADPQATNQGDANTFWTNLAGTPKHGDNDLALGSPYEVQFNQASLTGDSLIVAHNLDAPIFNPIIKDDNDEKISPDYEFTDNNTLTVDLTGFTPLSGTYTLQIPTVNASAVRDFPLDAEYDTGERIDGAIVYGKILSFGSGANDALKTVAHGITGITEWVSCYLMANNGTGTGIHISYVNSTVDDEQVFITSTNVGWESVTDRTSFTAKVFIKYLK